MTIDEIGRRRRRKPGDIAALRRTLWASLLLIEEHVSDPDPAVAIRAGHCLGTLAGAYLKALELADVVARLEQLEQRVGTAPSSIRRAS